MQLPASGVFLSSFLSFFVVLMIQLGSKSGAGRRKCARDNLLTVYSNLKWEKKVCEIKLTEQVSRDNEFIKLENKLKMLFFVFWENQGRTLTLFTASRVYLSEFFDPLSTQHLQLWASAEALQRLTAPFLFPPSSRVPVFSRPNENG